MRTPVRVWVHEFDDETLQRLARGIDRAVSDGQGVMPVYISSLGGDVYKLIAMQDLISAAKARGLQVATIALGSALSAAADLLACGSEGLRFVAPGTTVMVHESIDGWSPRKVREIAVLTSEAKRLDALCIERMDKHTGHPVGYWRKLIDANGGADLYLSAAEAVKHKLADHAIVPLGIVRDSEFLLAFEPTKKRKRAPRAKAAA